jgi:hypothetical protein
MEILNGNRTIRRRFTAFLLIAAVVIFPAHFAGQEQDEYAVKAAFIFNFSKFVEWPPAGSAGPFAICILGDDPFETTIDRLTQGKTAYGRAIQIRRVREAADAKTCQIVFAGAAERDKAARLVSAIRGTSVLTVGETPEFLRMGGMIALTMEDSHVNIVINTSATQTSNLKVSAKLLMLAKIYKGD